jgi:hypothetical protein
MHDWPAAHGGLTRGALLFKTSGGNTIFLKRLHRVKPAELRRSLSQGAASRNTIETLNFSEGSARLFPWDCVILMDN